MTPAELDDVRFVGARLTTPQIAARLHLSPRTVQTHLTDVLGKLDLTRRSEVAAEAARRGRSARPPDGRRRRARRRGIGRRGGGHGWVSLGGGSGGLTYYGSSVDYPTWWSGPTTLCVSNVGWNYGSGRVTAWSPFASAEYIGVSPVRPDASSAGGGP